MGLSVHGAFRVVSDKAVLAMPETAIGFFPDVGGSYFLSRLPGGLGMYLGLTGYRLDAADAVYTGLATHRVTDVAFVVSALEGNPQTPVDEVLRSLPPAAPTATSRLAEHRCEIDWCFSAPSVSEIHSRLRDHHSSWSRETLAVLDSASPQSLEVTFAVLSAGKRTEPAALFEDGAGRRHPSRPYPRLRRRRPCGFGRQGSIPVWGESLFGGFDAGGSSVWHRLP